MVRGQIAMVRGHYTLAETDLLEAQRLLHGLKHSLEEIDVVFRLAQLSSTRGDHASARRYVAELEQLNLPAARTDLAAEFGQLQVSLTTKEGDGS